jgi:hypothetical protein
MSRLVLCCLSLPHCDQFPNVRLELHGSRVDRLVGIGCYDLTHPTGPGCGTIDVPRKPHRRHSIGVIVVRLSRRGARALHAGEIGWSALMAPPKTGCLYFATNAPGL